MTDRPGIPDSWSGRSDAARRADLDWLYGRGAGAQREPDATVADQAPVPSRPVAASAPAAAARPRVSTPAYELTEEPAPRPRRPASSAGGAGPRSTRSTRPAAGRPAEQRRPEQLGATERPRRRRRRVPRFVKLFRTLLLLVLVWIVYLVVVPVFALSRMPTATQAAATITDQPGTAILLVGSDARTDDPDWGNSRADSVMLLYQPPTGRSVLVSLPRDSYVDIPGYGAGKLNSAYAYGGAALLGETVEQATGVHLDGYLEIGFDGFVNLVDAVGGVDVCLTQPISVDEITLPVGCQELDGAGALAYVRMRYEDPRGDIGRAERQREIIGKVVHRALNPTTVLNPVKYWRLNMAASSMLVKGDQTGIGDLLGGGRALMGVSGGEGLSLVVPISDPAGWSDTGESVVIWDRENALALFDEISRGDTSQLDRFAT